ncbi:MAG: sensor histidine kinase [Lachnospiraceae bacterium]
MAVWLVAAVMLLNGSFFEKLFVCLLYDIYFDALVLVLYSFFAKWMEYDANGYMVFGFARVAMVLSAKLLDIVFFELLIRFKQKDHWLVTKSVYIGLNAMVLATSIAERFLISIYYNATYNSIMKRDAMIVTIALVVIDIIVYIMCINLTRSNIDLIKERMKNAAYENKLQDIKATRELHEKTIKIRHDMKNELLKIKIKLEEEKIEEAKDYLEKILNVKLSKEHKIYTDNVLVDAIINKCIENCKNSGIEIKINVNGSIGNIDEMELAILLSNLLDNAVEAAVKTNDKWIEFTMCRNKDYLCIYIKNSYSGNVKKGDSGLLTTKQDKENHGYGLSNVRDIVKKHSGNYHYEMGETCFETKINLLTF